MYMIFLYLKLLRKLLLYECNFYLSENDAIIAEETIIYEHNFSLPEIVAKIV